MTRDPAPAPVPPRPITTPDPHQGYAIVISGTVPQFPGASVERLRARLEKRLGQDALGYRTPEIEWDIAVRVIGAHGETSEDEGRWDRP